MTRSLSFRGWLGQGLGGAVRQITQVVLCRQFLTDWFKIPFLGEWKLLSLGLVTPVLA